MAEIFSNMIKTVYGCLQEVQLTPDTTHMEKTTRHFRIKMLKISDKEHILKAARA